MENFGERLFELRKSKKLSQEEVADKLNVTRQSVSKWKRIKVCQILIKLYHYVSYLKYQQKNY